ncbi:MAG: 4a-hydroxytetrahydrobiopterin dehydratase [Balneolaceae bacterium]
MKPLTNDQIDNELENLDSWTFDEDMLHRNFEFSDFKTALSFIVRVGFEAEEQGHHPELFNVYNSVSIGLSTHDADDKVTEKDISLAKAIDKVYKTY